jgi:hypothetical protein
MELPKAQRAIRIAWITSLAGLGWCFGWRVAIVFHAPGRSLYLFGPWLLPGRSFDLGLLLIVILTLLVAYRNRVASILLFILFLLDRSFTFLFLYIFPIYFIGIWVGVTVVCGFLLSQGIWGTFAYHRLKKMGKDEATEPRQI